MTYNPAPGVQCRVNDIPMTLSADFISMFAHCRAADDIYYIETAHFRRLVEKLPAGGVAVDVGASGGIFTMGLARKAGAEGTVYAFEPARRANSILRHTVEQNGLDNVVIVPKAVSERDGTTDFYELPAMEQCVWRPEASALQLADPAPDADRYVVEIVTLDSYFLGDRGAASHKRIDVIKIDIEGFEAHALRGGIEVITRDRPFLAIDIHRSLVGDGDTEAEVRSLLMPLGYSFEREGHALICTHASEHRRPDAGR